MVASPTTGRARHRPAHLKERAPLTRASDSPSWLDPGALGSLLVVAGTTAFVLAQLHLNLVFGPNMDVGGDTAGHVVAVNYFVHHVLASGRLAGWDPEWFGGFPLYVFYFPLPAVIAGALTLVTSYAVAFKVTTILGVTFLPLAAYAFGRLSGFARPVPALMSVATIPYLFLFAPTNPHSSVYYSWNIDGGTLASMLAGEFSFSLSVTFALLFLGVFTYSQRTRRFRWLAALLFAATLLCHVVPGLFVAGAAAVITLSRPSRRGDSRSRADRIRRRAIGCVLARALCRLPPLFVVDELRTASEPSMTSSSRATPNKRCSGSRSPGSSSRSTADTVWRSSLGCSPRRASRPFVGYPTASSTTGAGCRSGSS